MGLLLNCGSGQRPFAKPWLNIDAQERWRPDYCFDLKEHWPFDDGTAEMVVFHHVLEHEGCGEGQPMLREAWRVLQPGGSLLVFVPDMRALAQGWLMRRVDDQVYMTNVYGAYMGDEHDRHKWGYTSFMLAAELAQLGPRVCNFNWRPIPGADLARDWWVLAMEAVK